MRNRQNNEVNAGSMADIAFLLLIFFLVTTTIETDTGLDRLLPRLDEISEVDIKQKNLFTVNLNGAGELLVEENLLEISQLKDAVIAFLDNGGDGTCNYCQGSRNPESSDNPDKAIVSLRSDRETKYEVYIAVQNEITAAYNFLRNREALKRYGRPYTDIEADYTNPQTDSKQKALLKEQVLHIQQLFPLKLSEAETRPK